MKRILVMATMLCMLAGVSGESVAQAQRPVPPNRCRVEVSHPGGEIDYQVERRHILDSQGKEVELDIHYTPDPDYPERRDEHPFVDDYLYFRTDGTLKEEKKVSTCKRDPGNPATAFWVHYAEDGIRVRDYQVYGSNGHLQKSCKFGTDGIVTTTTYESEGKPCHEQDTTYLATDGDYADFISPLVRLNLGTRRYTRPGDSKKLWLITEAIGHASQRESFYDKDGEPDLLRSYSPEGLTIYSYRNRHGDGIWKQNYRLVPVVMHDYVARSLIAVDVRAEYVLTSVELFQDNNKECVAYFTSTGSVYKEESTYEESPYSRSENIKPWILSLPDMVEHTIMPFPDDPRQIPTH